MEIAFAVIPFESARHKGAVRVALSIPKVSKRVPHPSRFWCMGRVGFFGPAFDQTENTEREKGGPPANLLSKLDQKGERNGLQLSNFTLSTDTKNDFAGNVTPAA